MANCHRYWQHVEWCRNVPIFTVGYLFAGFIVNDTCLSKSSFKQYANLASEMEWTEVQIKYKKKL